MFNALLGLIKRDIGNKMIKCGLLLIYLRNLKIHFLISNYLFFLLKQYLVV